MRPGRGVNPLASGMSENGQVTDIPRRAVSRTAKLASLPLGFAGRTVLGFGKRVTGMAADVVAAGIQERTAEQLFSVLGQLKGGAMKLGQALSVFEAALPEELAGPYRQALTKLQEAAPPLPAASVHKVLTEQLGPDWRKLFHEFDDHPAAAASIGQVHRAVWKVPRRKIGIPVAVKVQYPGAGDALIADLGQLARLSALFGVIQPGLDVKPLVTELKARVVEELDYELEAASQAAFAKVYEDDPEFGTKAARVLAGFRAAGVLTSIDVVSEDSDRFARIVTPALPHADYCIINEVEAGRTTGRATRAGDRLDEGAMEAAARDLLGRGVKRLAVVHAPEASVGVSAQGETCWQRAHALPAGFIRGTAGAGDAFLAGMLVGIHEEWGLERSLAFATAAAATCLRHPTTTQGVGSAGEIRRIVETMPLR